ncbi:MAG: ABC transporter substrate-binding protein [Clostridiales Family XIII bacterium]|jgi:iron complex transport system substrate-binding protein|nr:ABC transporter substrate-binding protein [Clostridiales Family XIII bacterium]
MKAKPRRAALCALSAALLLALNACGAQGTEARGTSQEGLPAHPRRVVALTSSLADLWLGAGGELVATTSDIAERSLDWDTDGILKVGGALRINEELILAAEPDLVIMSPTIPTHLRLADTLRAAGIAFLRVEVDSFEQYLDALKRFTELTGRADLYEANGLAQRARIEALLARAPRERAPTYLLLRASSSDVKAIAGDHSVCAMAEAFGAVGAADPSNAVFKELSLESVLSLDPDHIFVVTLGSDETASMAALARALTDGPLWGSLKAVQNGRFAVLPKELFHFKPNRRWGEAYEALGKILYPDVFG